MHSKPVEKLAMCTALKGNWQASIFFSVVILKIKCAGWFTGLLIPVGGLVLAKTDEVYLPLTTIALCKK